MISYPEILKLIVNPGLLQKVKIEQLEELIEQNPYFQTAHILILKALKYKNNQEFETQLAKSSAYISDRDLLFKFLNQEYEYFEPEEEEQKDGVEINEEKKEEPTGDKKFLRNRNVRRKINDTSEGMGANISETISSQIEFSSVDKNNKLEYSSEIYFIEEERDGNNNVITIDAGPEQIKKLKKKKDILDLDEEEVKKQEPKLKDEIDSGDPFELIESEEVEKEPSDKRNTQGEHFDINSYDDSGTELDKENDLIAKFIQENPRIEPKEIKEEQVEDISQDSIKENSSLLSETLIKVYIKQGLLDKAIESYEKLSLKYPEKSAYFASQIKILQEKINKQ